MIAIGASLSTIGLVLLGVVLAWRGADLAAWQLLPSMILVVLGPGLATMATQVLGTMSQDI